MISEKIKKDHEYSKGGKNRKDQQINQFVSLPPFRNSRQYYDYYQNEGKDKYGVVRNNGLVSGGSKSRNTSGF